MLGEDGAVGRKGECPRLAMPGNRAGSIDPSGSAGRATTNTKPARGEH